MTESREPEEAPQRPLEAWIVREDPFLFERVTVLESSQEPIAAMVPGWCACGCDGNRCNCFCGCGCGCW